MNYKIPKTEVENLISVYWQMLGELEAKAENEKNQLDIKLVEGAYRVLNRAGITDAKPRWLRDGV
jgi:hypothetical protein